MEQGRAVRSKRGVGDKHKGECGGSAVSYTHLTLPTNSRV